MIPLDGSMGFPFELREGRIWVEAKVKGATMTGILDTGADGTGIDQGLSEELGLRPRQARSATITAGEVEVTKTDPVTFEFGNASLTADEANILPLSGHIKGLNFILGFDAMRKIPFTIDYSKSLIKFGSTPEATLVEFVLRKDIRPTAELEVAGARLSAVLDTGSGTGISFPVAWVKKNLARLPLADPQKRVILGLEYESQKFVLEKILLGGTSLNKVEAQSVATEEDSLGVQESSLAEVGNPVLKMFKQIGIDGRRRMITFVHK